jgi:hypothetical protein
LPDGRLAHATEKEAQRLLSFYGDQTEAPEIEVKSRRQAKRLRTKAVPAPQLIAQLEEEAEIQFVVKEIARFLSN